MRFVLEQSKRRLEREEREAMWSRVAEKLCPGCQKGWRKLPQGSTHCKFCLKEKHRLDYFWSQCESCGMTDSIPKGKFLCGLCYKQNRDPLGFKLDQIPKRFQYRDDIDAKPVIVTPRPRHQVPLGLKFLKFLDSHGPIFLVGFWIGIAALIAMR